MRLSTLVKNLQGELLYKGNNWEREVEFLCHDTQTNCKGGLFFCLSGGVCDGHAYAEQAVKKGAVALVVEKQLNLPVPQFLVEDTRKALSLAAAIYYGSPAEHLKIIGVTGTNGKTTTAHMLASILRAAGKKVGVIGTLGIEYGKVQKPSALTTPDPIALHKAFAEMFLEGVEYVVMEVSAHALYYKKVCGVPFCACIFSNLSQDHLDFFPNMTAYKNAKTALFSPQTCALAIVNGDDETGREIVKMRENIGAKTACYGLTSPADAFAIVTDAGLGKTECVFNLNDELLRVSLRFTGVHNVYNALSAAVCAKQLGIDSHDIAQGLHEIKGVNGRLEWVATYDGADIFVDFAHTPDGLEKTLDALRLHCKGRLICLFGCGGNRDKTKRAPMGETVAKKSDFAVLTADNPRYEDPLDIIAEIEKGYRRFSQKYVVVPIRERAIEYALERLQPRDILLVAGKGGERYQEIMGIKYAFNDNDIIKKWIEKNRESDGVLR